MRTTDIGQLVAYPIVLLAIAYPLGLYMARLAAPASGRGRWFTAPERALYRLAGVDAAKGMTWLDYAVALIAFNALGALAVYALQRLQAVLPLNPQAHGRRHARLVVQHGGQLRDQHELAGLRAANRR